MSLTTGEMSAADLAAVVGNNDGMGFGGNGAWWIILLFLVLFNGNGWGNGYGGGNNGGAGGLYPWMNQAEITSDGFRDQMLNGNISGIRDSLNGISTQLCNCCSDMQMANMNSAFGIQNALNQGFISTQAQLAQCCCDNRAATADVKYTIANEGCQTRANATANTQAILDKLCQLELDGYKRENDNLRSQLTAANLAASQTAQNAFIAQGFANEVDQLYNRLNSCPVPTTPVYGRTPIFTCAQNVAGGCGCNGFNN